PGFPAVAELAVHLNGRDFPSCHGVLRSRLRPFLRFDSNRRSGGEHRRRSPVVERPHRGIGVKDVCYARMEAAERTARAYVRPVSRIEPAYRGKAPLQPRTSAPRGFAGDHRVAEPAGYVCLRCLTIVTEEAAVADLEPQIRGARADAGDADVVGR